MVAQKLPSTAKAAITEEPCVNCHRPMLPLFPDIPWAQLPFTGDFSEYCQSCRNSVASAIWGKSGKWAQLVSYNYAYLNGDHWCTPYTMAPTNPETVQLLAGLKTLHQYGIITTCSQPFEHTVRKDAKTGRWFEKRQRPYLIFSIPTVHSQLPQANLRAFVSHVMSLGSIDATIFSEYHKYPVSTGREYYLAQEVASIGINTGNSTTQTETNDLYHFRSSAPPSDSLDHYVTLERTARNKKALSNASWDFHTHLPFTDVNDLPLATDGWTAFHVKSDASSAAKPLYVQIAAKGWYEEMDLQKLVREQLDLAGLKRIYPDPAKARSA